MIELLPYSRKAPSGGKETGEQAILPVTITEPKRFGHGAVVAGNEMFMGGGFNSTSAVVTNFHKFNFLTKQWTNLAPLPLVGLRYSALLRVGNDIRPYGLSDRKDAFAITGNAWRLLGNSPEWMMYGYVHGWHNGKLYVAGGDGSTVNGLARNRKTVLEWDPVADKWTFLPDLPFLSIYSVGGIAGGKLWIYGGNGVNAGSPYIWFYDIATKVWTQGPIHPSGLSRALSFGASNGNRLIMGGGTDTNGRSKEVYVFDLDTYAWEQLPDIAVPMTGASAVVYDEKIWIFGGQNTAVLNSFFSYDIRRV